MKNFLRGNIKILLISIGVAVTIYFLLGISTPSGWPWESSYSQGTRLGVAIGVFLVMFGIMKMQKFLRGDLNILLILTGVAIIIYLLLGLWYSPLRDSKYVPDFSQGQRLGAGVGFFLISFGIMSGIKKHLGSR